MFDYKVPWVKTALNAQKFRVVQPRVDRTKYKSADQKKIKKINKVAKHWIEGGLLRKNPQEKDNNDGPSVLGPQ